MKELVSALLLLVTLLGAGAATGVVDVNLPALTEGGTGTPDAGIGLPMPYREATPDVSIGPVLPNPPAPFSARDGGDEVEQAPGGRKNTEPERTEPQVVGQPQMALEADDNAQDFCVTRVPVVLHYEPVHGSTMPWATFPAGAYLALDGPQTNPEWKFVTANGNNGWVWGLDCK